MKKLAIVYGCLVLLAALAASPVIAQDQPLELVSPRTGEDWAAGSKHFIIWNADPEKVRDGVKVSYTTDDGQTWDEVGIAGGAEDRMLWTVPDRHYDVCRIRLVTIDTGLVVKSKVIKILPAQQLHEYHWVKVGVDEPFAPREGAGALTFKDRMWLIGGFNPIDKIHFPKLCNNEVWSSADGRNWVLEKPNTFDKKFKPGVDWPGRHNAGYAVFNDKMWIVGGDAVQGAHQFDTWYSSDGRDWTQASGVELPPWAPRVLHYTVVFQDKIWIMGGQTLPQLAQAPDFLYNDLWNTIDGMHWKQVVPKSPRWQSRGEICGSAVFKDRIWVLGGGTSDTPTFPDRTYRNDVWSSPNGIDWDCLTDAAPWRPRQSHSVAIYDDQLWVVAGSTAQDNTSLSNNEVWHSEDGVNWYEVPNTPWAPRYSASVYVFKNALWVVAGSNMKSDVWKLARPE